MSRVAPYSTQDTAQAAKWLDYVADSFAGISGTAARIGAIQEAIDKLERRELIGPAVASLLAEIFDVPHCAALELA
ncbi:hypothetical protein BK022_16160 [Methylorubrum extorquens]|uniref:Uncharacterized protein n=1 Tax=Methylorubrum extorquens TaxID=408 RepID=A0A1S1NYN0_METEX|nr:hypothetical protein BK022_16160 [Methylorubrum extorquens]